MIYTTYYNSPIGKILIATRDNKLIGAWFEGQKYYLSGLKQEIIEDNKNDVLLKTKCWLDRYFNNKQPSIDELNISFIGSEFRKSVWRILCTIPYGKTITYSDIAKQIARQRSVNKMSAQAVGGAVGHNPISIIVPCHRVIGKNGNLTGYAGGIDKKAYLLKHENVDIII